MFEITDLGNNHWLVVEKSDDGATLSERIYAARPGQSIEDAIAEPLGDPTP